MKKIFLLFFASLLVLSCTKDAELADSSADLSTTLAQYDDTNMGIYKGLFTTVGTMERGTIEINITPDNYGVATLKLVSGQVINFRADRTIAAGAELQDLVFSSSSVIASFKLSADLDGNNVQISDVIYKGITSGAIAAHENSRAPVTPITGVLACDDCDAHPLLVTGDTGTFSLLFVGDGSADDTVSALADVGAPAPLTIGGAQAGCVDGGATTTCDVAGGDLIGTNDIAWIGTHTYNNGGDCSSAAGTWSLNSGNHGSYTGTFTSDTASCDAPANDTCAAAEAIACGDSVTGSTLLSTDDNGDGRFDNWYVLSGLNSGDAITISMCAASDYDTWLGVYDACAGAVIVANDDSCGLQSEVSFLSDGSDVWIETQGFSASRGNYSLDVTCTPASPDVGPGSDDCASAVTIGCGESGTGDTSTNTDTDAQYGNDAWYNLTGLTPGDDVTVSLCTDTTYDSRLTLYTACGVLFDQLDDSCGLQSEITFNTDGSDMLIGVQAFSTGSGPYQVNVTCVTPAPGQQTTNRTISAADQLIMKSKLKK